jgi:hypothetical protein
MSDPEDVVRKTDAFIGRYRGGGAPEDLPVLTEIVDLANPAAAASGRPTGAPSTWNEAQLRAFEQRIVEAVLAMIRPALSDLLANQINALVRDAVRKVVDREIALSQGRQEPGR